MDFLTRDRRRSSVIQSVIQTSRPLPGCIGLVGPGDKPARVTCYGGSTLLVEREKDTKSERHNDTSSSQSISDLPLLR